MKARYTGKGYHLPPKVMSFEQRRIMNTQLEKDVEEIAIIVAMENGFTLENIREKNRRGAVVLVRQIAHKIAREKTNAPHSLIGEIIGNKDHSTCMHSINVINTYIETKSKFVIEVYNRSKLAVERLTNHLGIDFAILRNIESMAQL